MLLVCCLICLFGRVGVVLGLLVWVRCLARGLVWVGFVACVFGLLVDCWLMGFMCGCACAILLCGCVSCYGLTFYYLLDWFVIALIVLLLGMYLCAPV